MVKQPRLRWKPRVRTVAVGAGLAAGGMLMSTVGIAYYVVRVLTDPRRSSAQDDYVMTPFETGAEHEEVLFPSRNGAHTIHGWWFIRPETNRVIIGCTGYRGSKSELIGISTALWRAGFNVLLFDYHGHGAGRGASVTLAYREVGDFLTALDYAEQRIPGARIGVIGYSMGAAVAIMGSARRPEVRAVIADSPFATHADVVSHNVTRVIRVSGRPITTVADFFLKRRAGYRAGDVTPVRDAAALAPRPLLVIHGTQDHMIPVSHGKRVYEAAGEPKELWLGEGADHCGTYFLDRQTYCRRVVTFFNRYLGDAAPVSEATVIRDHSSYVTNQSGRNGEGM